MRMPLARSLKVGGKRLIRLKLNGADAPADSYDSVKLLLELGAATVGLRVKLC